MGRFASTTQFYSRYREPYSPRFFAKLAKELRLRGAERLLDVGCGPALLALGFAPYAGSCTGIDPEPGMIAEAAKAASEAGVTLSLIHGQIEQFSATHGFDIVTIGRALHWLDRERALAVLERIVVPGGRVLICGARSEGNDKTPWVKAYDDVRRKWVDESERRRNRPDSKTWFTGTGFAEAGVIEVAENRTVTVPELIGRALSRSVTSPEKLGERREAFEADIEEVLTPFAKNGFLEERIVARAAVFEHRPK